RWSRWCPRPTDPRRTSPRRGCCTRSQPGRPRRPAPVLVASRSPCVVATAAAGRVVGRTLPRPASRASVGAVASSSALEAEGDTRGEAREDDLGEVVHGRGAALDDPAVTAVGPHVPVRVDAGRDRGQRPVVAVGEDARPRLEALLLTGGALAEG